MSHKVIYFSPSRAIRHFLNFHHYKEIQSRAMSNIYLTVSAFFLITPFKPWGEAEVIEGKGGVDSQSPLEAAPLVYLYFVRRDTFLPGL